MKRWVQISLAATVIALGVVGYLVFQPPPETVKTCLRTKLASAFGGVDDALLLAALQRATHAGSDVTINSQNFASPELTALSEPNTWNAIAGCRALFIPTAAALRPPRYAVSVHVLDGRGNQQVPVLGAQVYAKPAGPYCTTDGAGACTLTFLDGVPQDRIARHFVEPHRRSRCC